MTYGAFRRGAALSVGALAFAALLGTASMSPASAQSPVNQDPLQDRPSTSPSLGGDETPDIPDGDRATRGDRLKELRRLNDVQQNIIRTPGQKPETEPSPARQALGDP